MKIYLIRHGETTGDIEDRYGGSYDDHLSEKGISQAEELAEKISSFGVEKIYTSTLIRAKETAEILNKKLNVSIDEVLGIKERNIYGKLSGMVKAEAREKFPELAEALRDYRNTIEGAESYEEATERMKIAFEEITASESEVVAVITHGGTIKTFFREFLKREVESVGDCGFAELEISNGEIKLLSVEGVNFK